MPRSRSDAADSAAMPPATERTRGVEDRPSADLRVLMISPRGNARGDRGLGNGATDLPSQDQPATRLVLHWWGANGEERWRVERQPRLMLVTIVCLGLVVSVAASPSRQLTGRRLFDNRRSEASRDGRSDGGLGHLPADISSTSVQLGALGRNRGVAPGSPFSLSLLHADA
jgi:hypothetical protein